MKVRVTPLPSGRVAKVALRGVTIGGTRRGAWHGEVGVVRGAEQLERALGRLAPS